MYGWAHYSPDPSFIAGIFSALIPRIPAMTINIFSQIGIVLLLGLVTKNSILLVEFANQRMAKGLSAKDAMLEAAVIRFRPILMTAVGTITGILPIAIGFGAGAESRRAMGVAAVGGMLSATILTFFVVPVVYTLFDDWRHKRTGMSRVVLVLLLPLMFFGLADDASAQEEASKVSTALTLPLAIETALQYNADIRTAKTEIEKRRDIVIEARSGLLPSVTIIGDYEATDKNLIESFNDRSFGTDENWSTKAEVRQPLYAGGKSIYVF